ncbi:MAG: sulfite exporter TauE/SafE family protein [Chloroflexi bacterium]|nr:sulfite exporter TauE/SafE family protein [Chloroflexota bacterium]
MSAGTSAGIKQPMNYLVAGIIGLISGVTSGLFGVGGGIIMVPAMMFFMKLDIKVAVGTSLAVIIPTALMGSIKHYQLGHLDWRIALSLAPMAVVGGFLGAWLTKPIHSANLKQAFGGFLVLIGLRLLFFR